jgi:uncharacterized protein
MNDGPITDGPVNDDQIIDRINENGLEMITPEPPAEEIPVADRLWGIWAAIGAWLSSVGLLVGMQVIAIIAYVVIRTRQTGAFPEVFQIDWLMAVLTIAATFPAHLLTVLVCWLIVTNRGKRPFLKTIGWSWHPQFRMVHAAALALLMMGVALACEKLLPHRDTDMEKLLRMGASIRYLVAALAVLTAPFVEELVYRGLLYSAIERTRGRVAGIVVVSSLFALVHVPQYWGSVAAITAIMTLSLVLTLLRSYTGQLLPCIATHLVYNGVQAVALLFGSPSAAENVPAKTATILLGKLFSFYFGYFGWA